MTGKPSSLVRAAPFLAFFACHFALARACTPAVIWCPHESPDYDAYRAAPSSPLQKLTAEEFESSLTQVNVTEVIVAEELCVEDLRNSKVSLSFSLAFDIYLGLVKEMLRVSERNRKRDNGGRRDLRHCT